MIRFCNTDHLCNIRDVVREDGNLWEKTDYYSFGTPYEESFRVFHPSFQPYRYNGKEYDHIHGLDWYDYGARSYDPALATWTSVDPLAEKYPSISPYVYCHDNPINRIDPTGLADFFNTAGKFLYSDGNSKDPYIYIKKGETTQKLSNFSFTNNSKGLRSMMRIVFHYAYKVGATNNGTTIGVDRDQSVNKDGKTMAYTTPTDKNIRLLVKDGHFSKDVDQLYNMMSTLRHEKYHTELKGNDFEEEVNVIMKEMQSPDFKKTTKSFQDGACGYLQETLGNLYKISEEKYNKYIEKASSLLEQYGANGIPNYVDGYPIF